MQFHPNITSLLANLGVSSSQCQEVGQCLSIFDKLSAEGKKTALPSTIEIVFPLVFADEAAIQRSDQFQVLHQKPWSTNCYLSPKAIVSSSSARQVSKVLALCRFLGALFSIRGGGDLQNPGFASNDGGVVICVSNFRDVIISEDRQTASIGVDLHGSMFIGRVSGVLLGGGLSFLVGQQGFSCSGVVNYEVVLADSRIVNANAKENADLFWVLKGGASNFSIVTGFQMATVPTTAWGETRIYHASENDRLIKALMKYHNFIENDNKAIVYYHSAKDLTLLTLLYCDPVETRPAAFDCFYQIPHMKSGMAPGPKRILDVVEGIAAVLDMEKKFHEMRTMSSLPDWEVYQVAEEMRKQKEEELKDVEGLVLWMSFQAISPSALNATNAKGGSPMSIPVANHQWFLIMADWKHEKDEVRVRTACKEICDAAESKTKKTTPMFPLFTQTTLRGIKIHWHLMALRT